jgi:G:T/U-mismatch repair DNA glycosylase
MRVMFVGINPGVRSALTGHHFAGYSNRFWKLLYESRLVPEPITFADDDRLPEWGYGITNIVRGPHPASMGLRPHEFVEGRIRLRRKILRHRPRVVAFVGRDGVPRHVPCGEGADTLGSSRNGSATRRSSSCRIPAAAMPTTRTRRCCARSADWLGAL